MRKKLLQWMIAVALLIAAAGNVLYLTGAASNAAVTAGSIVLIVSWGATLLYKRFCQDTNVSDTGLDRVRGMITGILAVIWIITMGLTVFWRV